MQKPQVSSRHRNCLLYECCFWAYHLIVICLGLTILSRIIMASMISTDVLNSDQFKHSQQTVRLWNKGYIVDIKSVNTNNCPEGYDPLLKYVWPGTKSGCSCPVTYNNITMEYILIGVCSSELINEGCRQIAALPAQELQMWKGGKLLCLKRANSLTFYDSTRSTLDNGTAMKKCSNNKTYEVYTLPNMNCPISQTSNNSLASTATQLFLDSINNKNMFYISENGYPIADFKITQYDFCQFLDQINISPNKIGNYKLETVLYSNCKTTDPRYMTFDQLNQEEFYTNNTRVYNQISQLPGYPRPSINYAFKLGYIKYPQWSYQCRSLNSHNLNAATSELLFQSEKKSIQTLAYVCIPCLIIFVIIFRIFFILRHIISTRTKLSYNAIFLTQQQIQQQLPSLNLRNSRCKQAIIFAIQQIFRILTIIFIILTLLSFMESSVWIKSMFKYSCTETFVNDLFRYYQEQIDKTNDILVQVSFIWVVIEILDIIYFIIRFHFIDLAKLQVTQLSQKHQSANSGIIKLQNKEIALYQADQFRPQDSSQIIIPKDKQLKIRQIDQFMAQDAYYGAGQTKQNFFGDLQNSDYNLISAKKKKRKITKKKKNLFKEQK